jgi:hypothetical protein
MSSREEYLGGKVIVHAGDCLDVLPMLAPESIDSIVTDPPYELKFMGKGWDGTGVAFKRELWAEVLRVLKPGGHLLAFGGTRTAHRLATAIEDAGFEIRDCLGWISGQGFPKSLNVSRALAGSLPEAIQCVCDAGCSQTALGSQGGCQSYRGSDGELLRADEGHGRDAPPSQADAPRHSRGGSHLDGWGAAASHNHSTSSDRHSTDCSPRQIEALEGGQCADSVLSDMPSSTLNGRSMAAHRMAQSKRSTQRSDGGSVAFSSDPQSVRNANLPHCEKCGKIKVQSGLGTALKPAWEMIYLARKPLSEPTVAANVLRHGTGGLNIDACRVPGQVPSVPQPAFNSPTGKIYGFKAGEGRNGEMSRAPLGRFPANLIHDGSDEVEEAFAAFGERTSTPFRENVAVGDVLPLQRRTAGGFNDTGSASRFFFTAKADAHDRIGSRHPTVKPLDLIQYLVRLITPPGGLVLDPFAGAGTTAEAAFREGMRAVLIEREPEYQADIARRMELVLAGPDQKRHAIVKARGKVEDAGPLFGAAL